MARHPARKDCVNCGDPFRGAGTLCSDCVPEDRPPAAEPGRPYHLAMCRFCKADVMWENVGRLTREFPGGQVEALYYCVACRSTLEFASWQHQKF